MKCSRTSLYGGFLVGVVGVLVTAKAAGKGSSPAEILMITISGGKSHKVPFLELGSALVARGHHVTLVSGFPPTDSPRRGSIEEIAPPTFVSFIRNYTNLDLLGDRMAGKEPFMPIDLMHFGSQFLFQSCESFLSDSETKNLLTSKVDLIVLDGANAECALGLVYRLSAPFIFMNTIGFYTGSLSLAGNPAPYSVTPFFGHTFTDRMSLWERTFNSLLYLILNVMQEFVVRVVLQPIVNNHLGPEVPHLYHIARNASFILQNAHFSVTFPRPYLPNVVEIACIQCRPPRPLSKDLENFVSGGDEGFVFVSMGSLVRSGNMPEALRETFIKAFSALPYRVLLKWDASDNMRPDMPGNVRLEEWLPQQDILGHPKLRAFITHGGLNSILETVYHGVPIVTMPIFGDQEGNAAKAVLDGYAVKLELRDLTASMLASAIRQVVDDPRFKENVLYRSRILRDQPEPPLARAVYWTEYVLRQRGAFHLQSPAKDLNWVQYYLVDVAFLLLLTLWLAKTLVCRLCRRAPPHMLPSKFKTH